MVAVDDINYVFDVDGVLTPSRLPMDDALKEWIMQAGAGKKIYLLTGSDKDKTIEQVGRGFWEWVTASYQCGGNVVYSKGKKVYELEWDHGGKDLEEYLNFLLNNSLYPHRYGTHLEKRPGLVNFSIVGRDCTQAQRMEYNAWDSSYKEREAFCAGVVEKFPELDASVGGQISIDIYPKGKDKGQLTGLLEGPIYFYGDKTEPGGNDYALAKKLSYPDFAFTVINPAHTHQILSICWLLDTLDAESIG